MNGAAAIHDAEIALAGAHERGRGRGPLRGRVRQRRRDRPPLRRRGRRGRACGTGLGAALGDALLARRPRARRRSRCSAPRARRGVPVTVHVAIGTDTVHMHPALRRRRRSAPRPTSTSAASPPSSRAMDGGVYVNVGCAVLLPEVFLKAVAVVHNADPGAPRAHHDGQPRLPPPLPPARERGRAPGGAGLRDHRPPRDPRPAAARWRSCRRRGAESAPARARGRRRDAKAAARGRKGPSAREPLAAEVLAALARRASSSSAT